MNIAGIILAAIMIGILGCFIGFFLGFAGIKFQVEVDEKESAINEALPGNNCGGCGFAGCSGLAAAIAKGDAPVNACPVGGEAVAKKIGEIIGVSVDQGKRMTAFIHCMGDCNKATTAYEYTGTKDCRMAKYVPGGGPKACDMGCIGFGTCVQECPFDAIRIVNGIAVVDKEACKACGKCIEVCPNHLISMIPYDAKYEVACKSKQKGQVTMKMCSIGCIACTLCERNCPCQAIKVDDNCASIDQDLCNGCGICAEKCPKKVIVKV